MRTATPACHDPDKSLLFPPPRSRRTIKTDEGISMKERSFFPQVDSMFRFCVLLNSLKETQVFLREDRDGASPLLSAADQASISKRERT